MKTRAQKAKEKILDIRNLSFVADFPILKSVSWTVLRGERWVLLGANGAGKTSLISTICAYNTPSGGEMSVDGKTYSEYDWQKVREKIALVGSQLKRGFDGNERVGDVVVSGKFAMINYWGRITKRLREEAVEKLSKFGIARIADSRWAYISQGERQKVLLARALMIKPSVVFLDEPCSGLDPVARSEFVEFLNGLSADKSIPAIILATHHIEEIPESFTKAIALKKGEVAAIGPKEEVLTAKTLSYIYGAPCKVRRARGEYRLDVLR